MKEESAIFSLSLSLFVRAYFFSRKHKRRVIKLPFLEKVFRVFIFRV